MDESLRKHLLAKGFEKSSPSEREPPERLPALNSAVTADTKCYCNQLCGLKSKKFYKL